MLQPTQENPNKTPTQELIERRIYLIGGHKVILANDLASFYQVTTFNLNKTVKRNIARFPEDFMFQLTKEELEILIFQSGISTQRHGGRRYLPYVFTEQGVAMLSSVLRSERAIRVNIAIMRAFVRLRSILAAHKDLAQKVEALEKETKATFKVVFELIGPIQNDEEKSAQRRIGFRTQKQ